MHFVTSGFPHLLILRLRTEGAAISRAAREWWGTQWSGQTFMAIGATDPVLGPPVMRYLRTLIRNCPEPFVHPVAGHFVQEWGDEIAPLALAVFGNSASTTSANT